MNEAANRLRARRKRLGMNQQALAEHAGISARTVRNIEAGRTFNSDTMTRIESSLDALEEAAGIGLSEQAGAIQRRLDRLGISDREFHALTGIDRKTLRRAVAGEESVRASTLAAIEHALDRLEDERGYDPRSAATRSDERVSFRLSNAGGVGVILEGPASRLAELEATAARLIRGMQEPTGN